MVDNLLRRAKAFIGLEEEEGQVPPTQMDMTTFLKGGKKPKEKDESEYEIILYEPKVYEDSLNISMYLRQGSPVIINLRHLEPTEGTRLVDFVCGTAYAIDGQMTKIGDSIFLFTPKAIRITDVEEKSPISDTILSGEKKGGFFGDH